MMAAVKKGAWEREKHMTCGMVVNVDEGEDGDDDDEDNFDYGWGQVHRGKHHGIHHGQ